MASFDDILEHLDPSLVDEAIELLNNPSGILGVVKNFDPKEAADFVAETILGPQDMSDIITGGGIGGETDPYPGILSQAGDIALNELGLPVRTEDIKNIASAFTDPGAGGGITEIANIGFDLVKHLGKKKALDLVLSQLGMSHPLYAFIMKTPVGADLRTMGGDVLGMTGIPDSYNFLLNKGKNMLGFDVNAPDPIINTSQPSVIDQYVASLNQPTVTQNDDGTQTISGGTSDPSDDIVVTNLPVQTPTDHHPSMADVAGPSTPTPSLPNTGPPGRPVRGPHWAQGGLVSMARVLRR